MALLDIWVLSVIMQWFEKDRKKNCKTASKILTADLLWLVSLEII